MTHLVHPSILPSAVQEPAAEIPGRASYVPSGLLYTTEDELSFVRHLHAIALRRGSVRSLRLYVQTAPNRVWYGRGMRVDPGVVILTAKRLLEDAVRVLNGRRIA